jgi:hypothetical protein
MKPIGVMGNAPLMPATFPMLTSENFGNMVHANAPFKMFRNCVYIRDDISKYGDESFINFLNNKCSHLIITLANTLKPNDPDHKKYTDLSSFIDKVKVPIVIFGLGVKHSTEPSDKLNFSAVEFLNLLGQKTATLGVRGEITKKIILRDSNVKNVTVTGCPSFYTNPKALFGIQDKVSRIRNGKHSFSATDYKKNSEINLLMDAINSNSFILDPSNKFTHQYYLNCIKAREDEQIQPPYFLKAKKLAEKNISINKLKTIFQKNYRLFRNLDDWYNFNNEAIDFTYGTRFHVNMASILCGIPALWITHDDRTREMTSLFSLPSVPLLEAEKLNKQELIERVDYAKMIADLPQLFDRFNDYLNEHKLTKIKYEAT